MGTFELPLSWSHGGSDGLVDWRPLTLETGGRFIHAPQVGPGATLDSLRERLVVLAKEAPLVAQGLSADRQSRLMTLLAAAE
jgi:hypothetical protein